MPIQPLSDATSRVLTSTQTLDTATSVIKELIDNALDARASVISIEIAANTLDKIVVKDDGSGVGVEDRQLLCKRGCTSKIANLDDLAKLGGSFLGFRGTALASVAELSKEVIIVTKVDGERAATTLTFGPNGKLLSSASASHNVGTTIRVENFLAAIPVRRQVVLRNPGKVLDEIRKLLQAYAFARPYVKYSLKVLKAKSEKHNWSFAACKDEGQLLAAAVQTVGQAVASLCKTHSVKLDKNIGGDGLYQAEALLLDASNQDLSKCGNVGQYVSVDGRPVNQEKGIIRDLVKKYKSYLRATANNVPSKPFLVVHLKCPARSYDVNVEPAKDVILFHDQSKVHDVMELLLTKCYGELQQSKVTQSPKVVRTTADTDSSPFSVLLARKRPSLRQDDEEDTLANSPLKSELQTSSVHTRTSSPQRKSLVDMFSDAMRSVPLSSDSSLPGSQVPTMRSLPTITKSFNNMHDIDNDLAGTVSLSGDEELTPDEEENYNPRDIKLNNPFTRAKIHSLQRPRRSIPDINTVAQVQVSAGDQVQSFLNSPTPLHKLKRVNQTSPNQVNHPLTPDTSPLHDAIEPYQNPGPPFPRRAKRIEDDDEESDTNLVDNTILAEQRPRQSTLVGWNKVPTFDDRYQQRTSAKLQLDLRGGQHNLVSNVPQDLKYANKPFRSPLKSKRSDMAPVSGKNIQGKRPQPTKAITPFESSPANSLDFDEDLQEILDFERRKRVVNQRHNVNQPFLNPADLARIQCGSDIAADLASTQASKPASNGDITDAPPSHGSLATKANLAWNNMSIVSPQRSNPHQNRYMAAIRKLDSQPTKEMASSNNMNQIDADITAFGDGTTQDSEADALLTKVDPRGYLMSIRRSLVHSSDRKSAARRANSSRLPFETISTNEKKHNLSATPVDKFPSVDKLGTSYALLACYDSYCKTGSIDDIAWSPASKDVENWQHGLQILLEKHRQAKNTAEDGGENYSGFVACPELSLSTALRAHIDSLL